MLNDSARAMLNQVPQEDPSPDAPPTWLKDLAEQYSKMCQDMEAKAPSTKKKVSWPASSWNELGVSQEVGVIPESSRQILNMLDLDPKRSFENSRPDIAYKNGDGFTSTTDGFKIFRAQKGEGQGAFFYFFGFLEGENPKTPEKDS